MISVMALGGNDEYDHEGNINALIEKSVILPI